MVDCLPFVAAESIAGVAPFQIAPCRNNPIQMKDDSSRIPSREVETREDDFWLNRCRTAKTLDEQKETFGDLFYFLKTLRGPNQGTTNDLPPGIIQRRDGVGILAAQENICRSILTEWPYASVSVLVDKVMDLCPVSVVISTSSALLKEISAFGNKERKCPQSFERLAATSSWTPASTSLPLSSIVQACWATIQRLLLSPPSPTHGEFESDVECQQFVSSTVMLLPQILANASDATKLRLPLHGTPTKFYSRLVYVSWTAGGLYPKILIRQMIQMRHSDHVAKGLIQRSFDGEDHEEINLEGFVDSLDLSPREKATMMLALLQYASNQRKTPWNSVAHHNRYRDVLSRARNVCNSLFWSSSIEDQERIIEQLVFSHKASIPGYPERSNHTEKERNKDARRWSQLVVDSFGPASTEKRHDWKLIFSNHLVSIADRWSQWTFVQEVDGRQQHHVSLVLWHGLVALASASVSLKDPNQRSLTMAIVNGVSHRLSSTISMIRQDGMRIAQQLALGLGEDSLRFDEYDSDHENLTDDEEDLEIAKNYQQRNSSTHSIRETKHPTQCRPHMYPDEEYESELEDENVDDNTDDHHKESKTNDGINYELDVREEDDDVSLTWEDELIPFDLEDDEDDLRETPRPLHLLQALDLLRTGENHDHAYSRHEAALDALPALIQSRPDNLIDVAVSLALQLLRMEDKFNITDFGAKKEFPIRLLLVEEPLLIGQTLIEQLFEESGLADRLLIIRCLQCAAFELSGNKSLAESMTKKLNESSSSKRMAPSVNNRGENVAVEVHKDQISRVVSKTRRKRSRSQQRTVRNHFSAIAPMWFYSLISGFLKHKDDEVLWTGPTGSILLTYFLRCLATIVEFSGVQASQVLANDLLDLVWAFRAADVAEVRLSVLVAVSTSIAVLSDERLTDLLFGGVGIPKVISEMCRSDPDQECRSLCKTISSSLNEVLNNVNY